MTKTARTSRCIDAILEEHGAPDYWTDAEMAAIWDACVEKALFDDVEDFICALIVRARRVAA